MDKGIYFVISSGRNSSTAVLVQQEIGAEGQPMILHNGALIFNGNGEGTVRETMTLPREYAKDFMRFCTEHDYTCAVVFGDCDCVVTNREDAYASESFMKFSLVDSTLVAEDPDDLDKLVPGRIRPNKMMIVDKDTKKIDIAEGLIEEAFGERMSVYKSGDEYVDVMPLGMNKGTGLSILMKDLGINKNEVMAIGDSGNDVGMLKMASLSVAMGNGEPGTKKAAKFITGTNDCDGVRSALEKFIGLDNNHRNLN
jgi:Cof subfamily protein (haloacid dehalogenase superfamily)